MILFKRYKTENKLLKQRIDNLEKESVNLAERLIKGQVVNAQNSELIDILKNENKKLKEKLNELEIRNKENESLLSFNQNNDQENEIQMLTQQVTTLMHENNILRESPVTQKLEEELVQIKMRDAEAQLAIKELQKTINTLNLEYQEFLQAKQNGHKSDIQIIEEELLRVKMREAECQSEMKLINLKLMQMETEKQVAYNQIKRQDDEIKRLNNLITQYQNKELDSKNQMNELRHQIDDKEAKMKELSMTHKLKEVEDAHLIAELRQRVAALEVQIQELVTTGQLNESDHVLFNGESNATAQFNENYRKSLNKTLSNHDPIDFLCTEYLESDDEDDFLAKSTKKQVQEDIFKIADVNLLLDDNMNSITNDFLKDTKNDSDNDNS